MSKPYTHRLVRNKVQAPNAPVGVIMDVATLYRMPEGLNVAKAQDALLQFGEDPQRIQMRVFIDHNYCIAKMKELADRDWAVTNGCDPAAEDFKVKASEYAAHIEDIDQTLRNKIAAPDSAGTIGGLRH